VFHRHRHGGFELPVIHNIDVLDKLPKVLVEVAVRPPLLWVYVKHSRRDCKTHSKRRRKEAAQSDLWFYGAGVGLKFVLVVAVIIAKDELRSKNVERWDEVKRIDRRQYRSTDTTRDSFLSDSPSPWSGETFEETFPARRKEQYAI
jgi:predicted Co/Zn/Cd cation transporter (cation efflux family)